MAAADPFGTAARREVVLDAWRASSARFREDANAEEDLVRGGYRDRLLVELAQNAADAARLAGVPGRLRVELTLDPEPVLLVSNTGHPLDPDGVTGLSTLRASAKRHSDTIGRFGVGFAAVLAVSDAPEIRSRDGGARFSLADSLAAAGALPELTTELERRSFRPPVLRLPFPSATPPEPGFDTTVVLPLRDGAAVESVLAGIASLDEALLLVLDPVVDVTVVVPGSQPERRFHLDRGDDRAVIVTSTRDDAGRGPSDWTEEGRATWLVERRSGVLPAALLETLASEERERSTWTVLWALPADGGEVATPVVHAPTPTDEPLTLPALLVASLPLQPDRRHVLPGPVTDLVLEEAAAAYVTLASRMSEPSLVPTGLPAGAVDGRLHELVRERLRQAVLVDGRRPQEVVWVPGLDEQVLSHLQPVLPELVGPPWSRSAAALRVLEVPERAVADIVDALASVRAEPTWWGRLYVLLDAGGVGRDDLGALPVPLLDGRLVRGARGLLLPSESLPPEVDTDLLAELSLRVVHPAAVAGSRLLARLGAAETDAGALLRDPALAAALARADDDGDDEQLLRLARLVLALLGAAPDLVTLPGGALAELPWLAQLVLPGADGDLHFADELALPGSPLLELAPDDLVAVDVSALSPAVGPESLRAVGVRDAFPVVLLRDVSPEADPAELSAPVAALDDVDGWLDELALAHPGAVILRATAVADLDLVADDDWPRAFELLNVDRSTLDAVLAPAELQRPDGSVFTRPSYATWWLSRHALLAGRPPSHWSTGQDPLLAWLLPPVPVDVDPSLQRALGVRTTLSALLAEPGGPGSTLELLTDAAVPPRVLSALMTRLAESSAVSGSPAEDSSSQLPEPPERLRALVAAATQGKDATEVVSAEDVVVLDRPDLLAVVTATGTPHLRVPLPLAETLAELLDIDVASQRWPNRDVVGGTATPVPHREVLRQLLPDLDGALPDTWWEHEDLTWHGVETDWCVARGQVHATTLSGLARGLAWASGRWDLRWVLLELLLDPTAAALTLAEADLDQQMP